MAIASDSNPGRLVPEPPPADQRVRLLIDSDAANEIDDLYAIALAVATPERFAIEGFVATHFAASAFGTDGPASTEKSYRLIGELLDVAGAAGRWRVARGAHPMQYMDWPSEGEGVDFILERARAGTADDPLWVVALGAATNLASAIVKDPSIADRVRFVFHARSGETWPQRSVQYNVKGDVWAARTLLRSPAPLVWFDTGTNLCRSFEQTAATVAPTGRLGTYLHEFRRRNPYFMRSDKGFFDMADIAWMIRPGLCREEVVPAPTMDPYLFFDHDHVHGRMRRVYAIENDPTWDLLCQRLRWLRDQKA
ncbi:MAG: hypothetical protein GX591_07025 [Planctomycetes bacterium]|nr:hypothetical protein [Planctomycetota bacterium]